MKQRNPKITYSLIAYWLYTSHKKKFLYILKFKKISFWKE